MAIYSFRVEMISRNKTNAVNAVQKAAHHAGENLRRLSIGEGGASEQYTYFRRKNIIYSKILKPPAAPDWADDREKLWNAVEDAEKRADAQVVREIMLALPHELSNQQNIELLQTYVQQEFVERGMVADISIHKPKKHSDQRNVYAFVLLTTRKITDEGFESKKCREWNKSSLLRQWREQWANHLNQALNNAGYSIRVDHRSLKEQGIVDREPTTHRGRNSTDPKNVTQPTETQANPSTNELQMELPQSLVATVAVVRVSVMFKAKKQKPIWQHYSYDMFDADKLTQGALVRLTPETDRDRNPKKISYRVDLLKKPASVASDPPSSQQ